MHKYSTHKSALKKLFSLLVTTSLKRIVENPSINYFKKQAPVYDERSRRKLWNWLRRRESTALFDLLGSVAGENVVDLGCGSGYYTRLALERSAKHVISIDVTASMVKNLPKQNVTGLVADATTAQLRKSCDKILCAGLLEFVSDPKAVLANARTMVVDSGVMGLLVPVENMWVTGYKMYHACHGITVNTFTEQSLAEAVKSHGWGIKKTCFIFPFTLVLRLEAI